MDLSIFKGFSLSPQVKFEKLSTQKNFFIKNKYKINRTSSGEATTYCGKVEDSLKHQFEVYRFAKNIIVKNKLKAVLDIGCGFAAKLKELIFPLCQDITGVDTECSIKFCRDKYNFGRWYVDNIENSMLKINNKYDLIISADVIEHLTDPDSLIEYIKRFCHPETLIIISTPERDMVHGKKHLGPPSNPAHVREWNKSEFNNYLKSKGLLIIKHILIPDYKKSWRTNIRSLLQISINKCQTVLCKLSLG